MATDKTDEKRRFHRIFYNADATLSHKEASFPCKIIDISLKGCLLKVDQPLIENQDALYGLNINLSDEISIRMDLLVSHINGEKAGFKCVHIDIDSISNLRRLVELNLGDSEILERELVSLSGSN